MLGSEVQGNCVFRAWSRIQSRGQAILGGIDACAIRLNRQSTCVRITAATVATVGLPMILFGGSFMLLYAGQVPFGKLSAAQLIGLSFPGILTGISIFDRYSWVAGFNLFSLPEGIKKRLEVEIWDVELPNDYKGRVREFLTKNININNVPGRNQV